MRSGTWDHQDIRHGSDTASRRSVTLDQVLARAAKVTGTNWELELEELEEPPRASQCPRRAQVAHES